MLNDNSVFSTQLVLPYSAVNANGRIKADWLLNAFQDLASSQCHLLGISGFDMAKKQLKWVVAQYQIHIHDTMEWEMPLILKTWRAPWKNLYEVRRFSLGQEDASPMVTATSVWILIKAKTGKPVRLAPHMPEELLRESAPEPPELIRFSELGEFHHETCFPVRFLDLDLNQHVNNRVYLRWAIESLPAPYCFQYSPARCTVSYKKESLFGDQVLSRVKVNFTDHELATEHAIIRKKTGEELARLGIDWNEISPINIFGQ